MNARLPSSPCSSPVQKANRKEGPVTLYGLKVKPNGHEVTLKTLGMGGPDRGRDDEFGHRAADHIGAYGSTLVKTPALDRLAGEGTRFAQAMSSAPLVSTSTGLPRNDGSSRCSTDA